ncbi:MAG: hypothetical protein Q9175_001157 [Cornicularia normoerica]
MTRGHATTQRLALQSRPSTPICRTCLRQIRAASSAAVPVETAPIEPSPTDRAPLPLTASQSHSITYKLKASVLLSRPPLLTRDLTPFEKSFFLYQRRLNERLALPFTRYFYYQRGTPGDIEWKRKIKDRKTPARDIGVYNAYGDEGWNDELLVGDTVSEPEEQVEKLLRDAEVEVTERDIQGEGKVVKKEEVEKPMPRVTEADKAGDMKSLNRALQKTLYLVVSRGKGQWEFPSAELARQESLHTGAERIIVQTGGLNMNTWVVGNIPIGHQVYNYSQGIVNEESGSLLRGEKLFFMKARILAGQANLKDNQFGLEDFQWLAKEEIQKAFHPRSWNAVKNILPER